MCYIYIYIYICIFFKCKSLKEEIIPQQAAGFFGTITCEAFKISTESWEKNV